MNPKLQIYGVYANVLAKIQQHQQQKKPCQFNTE